MATNSTSRRTWHWWVNAVSFVSIVIIGIVLLLAELKLGGGKITNAMKDIANALAYVVVAACSFVYVSGKLRRKNGLVYMIIWVGAVILITLSYIIPMF